MSSKCSTIECERDIKGKKVKVIIKYYNDDISFANETEVYNRLKGKTFIPKLFEINEENKIIIIEKIETLTLKEYILKNEKIPPYIAKGLKYIKKELLELGIYYTGDMYKLEHIFIDDSQKSPKTNGIRIIDFDYYDYIDTSSDKFKEIKLNYEGKIEKEFKFLECDDEKSREKFINNLSLKFLEEQIINNFFKEMNV